MSEEQLRRDNTVYTRFEGYSDTLYCIHDEGSVNLETYIDFQDGDIRDVGVNGIQLQQLLAICIHRIERLQERAGGRIDYRGALINLRIAKAALDREEALAEDRLIDGELSA